MTDRGVPPALDPIDYRISAWMARHGVMLARVALGIVFLWFGALKFIPGWSPATDLAGRTLNQITFHTIPTDIAVLILAGLEVLIGIGLLTGKLLRVTLLLLFLQMLGTLTPLVLFPAETFTVIPLAPTLEGQYIIKNLVLIAAAVVVGATVRGEGGYVVAQRGGPRPRE